VNRFKLRLVLDLTQPTVASFGEIRDQVQLDTVSSLLLLLQLQLQLLEGLVGGLAPVVVLVGACMGGVLSQGWQVHTGIADSMWHLLLMCADGPVL
jgi:hypothetical protein